MSKKPTPSSKGIEIELDAWARFERAVDVVAKSPPQPKVKKKVAKRKKKPGK